MNELFDNVWLVLPAFGWLVFVVLVIFGSAAIADAIHELRFPSADDDDDDWREPWNYEWDEPFNMDEPADAKILKFDR